VKCGSSAFGAALIVRHDKDGATWYDGDASGVVPAFPATVVDTIGAGDSHAGGTLAGLAGWSLADAVLLGNAVASWVVSHRRRLRPDARGTTPRTQRRIDRCDSS
jgi:sugar/nucleoside kinase (ribokinase family)